LRFGLRQGDGDLPFDGVTIGGWTFRERAKPAAGWAEHGSQQVLPGAALLNFGPVNPPVSGATQSPRSTPTPVHT
jgi:hypothetical protein